MSLSLSHPRRVVCRRRCIASLSSCVLIVGLRGHRCRVVWSSQKRKENRTKMENIFIRYGKNDEARVWLCERGGRWGGASEGIGQMKRKASCGTGGLKV